MNEKKPNISVGRIAGGLFCIAALIMLLNVIRMLGFHYFNVYALMSALASGFVGVVLVMERSDKLLLIASAVMTLIMLVFGGVISFIAALLLLFVILVATTSYVPKSEELVKKTWFVPAIVMLLGRLFAINSFGTFIAALAMAGATLLCCLWVVFPNGLEKNGASDKAITGSECAPAVDGYCELFKHVLLLLLTCGIWYLIWIYRMTKYLNRVEGEEYRNPTSKLLLCMFIPFYATYWIYKSSQRIDKLAHSVGVESKLATPCLILCAFVPMVAPVLMQEKINTIIDVERGARGAAFDPAEKKVLPVTATAKGTVGYCDLFKHLLLLLLTCGIWNFIWVYRMTKYLNRVEGEAYRNPVTKLLLYMFIPFYAVYWIYKSSQRIDKLAGQVGVESRLGVLCLVLCLVVGLVPQMLMQEKINQIIVKETSEGI